MLHHLLFAPLVIVVLTANRASAEDECPPLKDDDNYYVVFHLEAGVGSAGYDVYTNAGNNDNKCDPPCGHAKCGRHYRSKQLDDWDHLPISKVKVSLHKDGILKRTFIFNCNGCTSMDFFRAANLYRDDYIDLNVNSTPDYFSIKGDSWFRNRRRFFIGNDKFKRRMPCDDDDGWMFVLERWGGLCGYAQNHDGRWPSILYSDQYSPNRKGFVKTKWEVPALMGNNAPYYVRTADVLTVSILVEGVLLIT